VAPTLEWWELGLRLLGATVFGGLIGFEREYNDQPAGFRTHILVTLGSALFTLAGAYGVSAFVDADVVRFDPTRVAAQVVTGIGFLGAGAILRQGINVRGLTTAASIWVTASIGVAVALGFWTAAAMTTLIALASLLLLRPMERVVLRSLQKGRLQGDPRPRLRGPAGQGQRRSRSPQCQRATDEDRGRTGRVSPGHHEPRASVRARY